ncbi:myosin heavy chain, non-muscle-like, partial [Sycon ciliatum]|uniref:myosin heavy chain, non-muscle-like n=1 Tax=Sycon ciliatum TaxID=27933 RepID=UPI0020AE0A64
MDDLAGREEFSSEAAANANLKVQLQILSRQRDQAREDARLWQDRASVAMEDAHSTQEVLTKQLDEALKHVANVQKRNSILQAERDELKVVLMQKDQEFQDRANSLAGVVDQLKGDLADANRKLQSSSRASDEHSYGRNTHTSSSSMTSSMTSFQDDLDRGERLRDTERSLRQVKARLLQVEGERDEAHRELDQLLSSFSVRRGQLQERLEQEHLQAQQLWKENEELVAQLNAAREEMNARVSEREVQELRDHISLMNEECTHVREQWRLAESKEQHSGETLTRAMATIGALRSERDALLSAAYERQEMIQSSRFTTESDHDANNASSSPEFYRESHSGPPTMRRSTGRNSPLASLTRPSRNRSLHRHASGDDDQPASGMPDAASTSGSAGDGGTPKKAKSGPSRVLAELVPYFSSGRASLRRRTGRAPPKNTVMSPSDEQMRPGSQMRMFAQELGSPTTPMHGSAVNYLDDASSVLTDGMISKRSSMGTDMFDASSQGAASRQSRDYDEMINREMDRLRGECKHKDELCLEMRNRLEQSLRATSSLRDEYDRLLSDASAAMKQIRQLKEKVFNRESPTPDVGLPKKESQFTEVRLPAEQELGVLLETRMMVSEVVEGLAAHKNGGLECGDHIMQINGISMVDKTPSATITALALAKDGCTKLTVLKAGEAFVPSKSLSNGHLPAASQSDLMPVRGRPQRKSKRWRIRQSVAEIIAGRDMSVPPDDDEKTNLRRTSSDHRLDQEPLSAREKFKRRPRRKTTAGEDPESIEAITQLRRMKPAKSTPNFAFIDQDDGTVPAEDGNQAPGVPADDEVFPNAGGNQGPQAGVSQSQVEADASWLLEQNIETGGGGSGGGVVSNLQ